jgi:glycosyltransferase involved in cell wall biosynthesis
VGTLYNCENLTSVPGLSIYTPSKWLPKFYSPEFLDIFTTNKRLKQIKALLKQKGCKKIILYIWRPEFGDMLDKFNYDLSCYHIDDEYTFSESDLPNDEAEVQLISKVDQVIIHSAGLLAKKGDINPNTIHIPNGVDFAAYSTPTAESEDMKNIPHPRIGYVGVIKKQLDFKLLVELAQRHPDFSFVFVGPYGYLGDSSQLVKKLEKLDNTYFLGAKKVEQLPSYTQHMDVCILCYLVNAYTNYIYPLKLHEYLATGKPVVSASINSVKEFEHVVKIANSTDEWSEALVQSLCEEETSHEQTLLRINVAKQYDWNLLVRKITRIFCEKLGPAYLEKFEDIERSTHS